MERAGLEGLDFYTLLHVFLCVRRGLETPKKPSKTNDGASRIFEIIALSTLLVAITLSRCRRSDPSGQAECQISGARAREIRFHANYAGVDSYDEASAAGYGRYVTNLRRSSVADEVSSDSPKLVLLQRREIQSLARPILRFGRIEAGRWMRSFFIL